MGARGYRRRVVARMHRYLQRECGSGGAHGTWRGRSRPWRKGGGGLAEGVGDWGVHGSRAWPLTSTTGGPPGHLTRLALPTRPSSPSSLTCTSPARTLISSSSSPREGRSSTTCPSEVRIQSTTRRGWWTPWPGPSPTCTAAASRTATSSRRTCSSRRPMRTRRSRCRILGARAGARAALVKGSGGGGPGGAVDLGWRVPRCVCVGPRAPLTVTPPSRAPRVQLVQAQERGGQQRDAHEGWGTHATPDPAREPASQRTAPSPPPSSFPRALPPSQTPAYVAPEILRGSYGPGVDVWALGAVLYVLLCGFTPFHDDNVLKLYAQISKAEVKFPSPHWNAVSPGMDMRATGEGGVGGVPPRRPPSHSGRRRGEPSPLPQRRRLLTALSSPPPFFCVAPDVACRSSSSSPAAVPARGRPPLSRGFAGAKDLVRCMLRADPDERFTPAQVMAHPWVTSMLQGSAPGPLGLAAEGLRRLNSRHQKQRAAKKETVVRRELEEAQTAAPPPVIGRILSRTRRNPPPSSGGVADPGLHRRRLRKMLIATRFVVRMRRAAERRRSRGRWSTWLSGLTGPPTASTQTALAASADPATERGRDAGRAEAGGVKEVAVLPKARPSGVKWSPGS